jgi:hypothetical protein
MRKQDFIMQLIEQLSRGLLPYVLDMVQSGNYEEAHAMIDQSVGELFGVGTDGLVRLSDTAVMERLQRHTALSWEDQALFLATLLKEDADIYKREGNDERYYARTVKALHLYIRLILSEEDPVVSEFVTDVSDLINELASYHLSAQTCAVLLRYYERLGEFSHAEDVLFEWLEMELALVQTDDPNPIEAGIAFYKRLLQMNDEALEAGDLPRTEVEASLAELLAT